jgi:putative transposase
MGEMMNKYKGRFQTETTRLKDWDYSTTGWYFVTICTRNQKPYFGEVIDSEFHFSLAGIIVAEEWVRTEALRPIVSLDEWVIMPNHLHGIIIIEDVETPRRGVCTNASKWKANSLGSIINQFKGACTRRIRKAGNTDFTWQSRYFDHIIRNEVALRRIRRYIQENPLKWALDRYYQASM